MFSRNIVDEPSARQRGVAAWGLGEVKKVMNKENQIHIHQIASIQWVLSLRIPFMSYHYSWLWSIWFFWLPPLSSSTGFVFPTATTRTGRDAAELLEAAATWQAAATRSRTSESELATDDIACGMWNFKWLQFRFVNGFVCVRYNLDMLYYSFEDNGANAG